MRLLESVATIVGGRGQCLSLFTLIVSLSFSVVAYTLPLMLVACVEAVNLLGFASSSEGSILDSG